MHFSLKVSFDTLQMRISLHTNMYKRSLNIGGMLKEFTIRVFIGRCDFVAKTTRSFIQKLILFKPFGICGTIAITSAMLLRMENGLLAQVPVIPIEPIAVLRTGAGQPLSTYSRTMTLPSPAEKLYLGFSVGFATDELVSGGAFLDSYTITLQDILNPSLAVLYLTADAQGWVLAPPTPSTIPITPSDITLNSIPFPNLPLLPTRQMAYSIMAPVPNELVGHQVNFYMDVFDNGNEVNSAGWVSEVVYVPEPGVLVLVTAGLFMLVVVRRRKNSVI